MKNQTLSNYLFHYNSHNKTWNAFPRECANEYWNNYDHNNDQILKSDKIETLLEIIDRIERSIAYLDKV